MQLFISLGLIASVVIWGLVSPATLDTFFSTALAATTRNFGWFSLWLVLGLVVLAFLLAFSPRPRLASVSAALPQQVRREAGPRAQRVLRESGSSER